MLVFLTLLYLPRAPLLFKMNQYPTFSITISLGSYTYSLKYNWYNKNTTKEYPNITLIQHWDFFLLPTYPISKKLFRGTTVSGPWDEWWTVVLVRGSYDWQGRSGTHVGRFICRLKISLLSRSSYTFIRISQYQNLGTSLMPIKMKVQ